MNKLLITGAATMITLASVAAHAQSSVTIYGLIDAGLTYTNSQITGTGGGHSNWEMTSGAVQYSRWGLRGAEDLGAGLKAIFTLESGFNLNNGQFSSSNRIFNRQAYVGLSSREYGALTLGRQTDGMVDFVAPLSLTGTEFGGTHFAHPLDNDNLNDSFQINNSVKYMSPDFGGLRFGALYGFSNQAGGFTNNRAYSFGMSYVWGALNFGAGYLQLNSARADRCAFRRVGQQSEDVRRWRELHLRSGCGGFRVLAHQARPILSDRAEWNFPELRGQRSLCADASGRTLWSVHLFARGRKRRRRPSPLESAECDGRLPLLAAHRYLHSERVATVEPKWHFAIGRGMD
jgi:hypothetical protein